ncbi:S-methyl-5-thioribose-1-phosphate isomerase [Streptomyces sp. NBC_00440]|uniref:S-methyl-5-thioribose-1-phosphate isomerase n=1 Tax=Streptomyces sp. NBC_00440 TaxID=2975741 RepID=UPI002E24C703
MTAPPTAASLGWEDGALIAVDQRTLPHVCRTLRLTTVDQVVEAVRTLAIRGAPAIALAGAFGVALSAAAHASPAGEAWAGGERVRADAERLVSTGPTAVHLARGVRRALGRLGEGPGAVLAEAQSMLAEYAATNRMLTRRAADLVESLLPERPLRILTHSDTGRFATGAVGTALGTILELAARRRVEEVLVGETRPLLQGSRLTAWELGEAGVPYRVVVDAAVPALMSRAMVDCVLVGADRIAVNGDTANRTGTYGLAVAAAHHDIPFLVVAPECTWDPGLPDGAGIVVEERDAQEVTHFEGTLVAPPGAAVHNPAFDVTPAPLITALVSESATHWPRRDKPPARHTARGKGAAARDIEALLTIVPDHPLPGLAVRDMVRLYAEPGMLGRLAARVARECHGPIDRILAVEARGFLLGAALAARTGSPLTLARRAGRLPGPVHETPNALTYGTSRLQVQKGALIPGERVLCVDDVLATGGTLLAAARLVAMSGARVQQCVALVELRGLGGRERLAGHPLLTLCELTA